MRFFTGLIEGEIGGDPVLIGGVIDTDSDQGATIVISKHKWDMQTYSQKLNLLHSQIIVTNHALNRVLEIGEENGNDTKENNQRHS